MEQMRHRPQSEQEKAEPETVEEPAAKETDVDLDSIDGILDEIDSVLEENSEEFVSGFKQHNGQ